MYIYIYIHNISAQAAPARASGRAARAAMRYPAAAWPWRRRALSRPACTAARSYLSICLPTYLSIYLSLSLSLYIYVYIYIHI